MRYLNNDELERYWFRYKSEGEPHGTATVSVMRRPLGQPMTRVLIWTRGQ